MPPKFFVDERHLETKSAIPLLTTAQVSHNNNTNDSSHPNSTKTKRGWKGRVIVSSSAGFEEVPVLDEAQPLTTIPPPPPPQQEPQKEEVKDPLLLWGEEEEAQEDKAHPTEASTTAHFRIPPEVQRRIAAAMKMKVASNTAYTQPQPQRKATSPTQAKEAHEGEEGVGQDVLSFSKHQRDEKASLAEETHTKRNKNKKQKRQQAASTAEEHEEGSNTAQNWDWAGALPVQHHAEAVDARNKHSNNNNNNNNKNDKSRSAVANNGEAPSSIRTPSATTTAKPLVRTRRWNRPATTNKQPPSAGEDAPPPAAAAPAFANAEDDVITFDSKVSGKKWDGLWQPHVAGGRPAGPASSCSSSSSASSRASSSPSLPRSPEGRADVTNAYHAGEEDDYIDANEAEKAVRLRRAAKLAQIQQLKPPTVHQQQHLNKHLDSYKDTIGLALDEVELGLRRPGSHGKKKGGDDGGERSEGDEDSDYDINALLRPTPPSSAADSSDGEEDASEVSSLSASSSSASSVSSDEEDGEERDATVARNTNRRGFGRGGRGAPADRNEEHQAADRVPDTTTPVRFHSVYFETHINTTAEGVPCHHTMLGIRKHESISIQGPCGIIGLGLGEVTVGGYFLGRKQISFFSEAERAVVAPVPPLGTKASEMRLPSALPASADLPHNNNNNNNNSMPGATSRYAKYAAAVAAAIAGENADVATTTRVVCPYDVAAVAARLPPSPYPTETNEAPPPPSPPIQEEPLGAHDDVDGLFGTVDWAWVEQTLGRWKAWKQGKRLLATILVIQPLLEEGATSTFTSTTTTTSADAPRLGMRKYFFRPGAPTTTTVADIRSKHDAMTKKEEREAPYLHIPAFLSSRKEPGIESALLHHVVPTIAKRCSNGVVMVTGATGVGKSLLCRFLLNTLFSQFAYPCHHPRHHHTRTSAGSSGSTPPPPSDIYYVELDVGQPEFGPPGQFAIYRLREALRRPHADHSVELLQSFYLGSTVAGSHCPRSAAVAVAALCAVVGQLSRRAPVVVNTHGWVLQTGRRVTVEVMRRLRPRQVVHLLPMKPRRRHHHHRRDGNTNQDAEEDEAAWVKDVGYLLDPVNGLNGRVVGRPYLVRAGTSATVAPRNHNHNTSPQQRKRAREASAPLSTDNHSSSSDNRHPNTAANEGPPPPPSSSLRRLSELPAVTAGDGRNHAAPSAATRHSKKSSQSRGRPEDAGQDESESAPWSGEIHLVYSAERTRADMTQQILEDRRNGTKGAVGRQRRWRSYVAPLLHHYMQVNPHLSCAANKEQEGEKEACHNAPPHTTTLLTASLYHLAQLIFVEMDEKEFSLLRPPPTTTTTTTATSDARQQQEAEQQLRWVAARLAHTLVAVEVRHVASNIATTTTTTSNHHNNNNSLREDEGVPVCSLARCPHGFSPTCYAFVESSEAYMVRERKIQLRLPLSRAVVAAVLQGGLATSAEAKGETSVGMSAPRVRLALASSEGLLKDTAFMEDYL